SAVPALPDNATPLVWLGKSKTSKTMTPVARGDALIPGISKRRSRDETAGLDEYLGSFLDMDSKARDEWADYLISLGIINDDQRYDFDVLRGAWETAGQLASEMYARGKKVSPRDALKIYAGSDRGSGAAGA